MTMEKSVRSVAATMLALLVLIVSTTCSKEGENTGPTPKPKYKVGIAYTTAGKNDHSYNEAAERGVRDARQAGDFELLEVEPSQLSDLEPALTSLATRGADLVIAVSFFYADPLKRVAPRFPKTKFVIIDGDVQNIPNVRPVLFHEHQGSFLVGAIAGKVTRTKKIGVVPAMDIPILNKFVAGYECGAAYANPGTQTVVNYIGTGPDSFNNPSKAMELARSQIRKGADVLYHVAAASGSGVIKAAQEGKVKAIGVDSDQSSLAEDTVVTSMLKHIDLAVKKSIQDAQKGSFVGGKSTPLGINSDGVDYVGFVEGRLLTSDVKAYAKQVRDAIAAGTIEVPEKRASAGEPCKLSSKL